MFASTNGKEDVHLHQDDIDGIRHLYAQNELAGDYLFGCAMVSFNSAPPTFPPGAAILLLLLPLVACLGLRQRSLYFKASSKYF